MSANSLKRTRTIQPVYPESARKRGVEGWVELAFTVTPNGTVEDVEVRNASPADVFDDAAVRAIRGWRFEPVGAQWRACGTARNGPAAVRAKPEPVTDIFFSLQGPPLASVRALFFGAPAVAVEFGPACPNPSRCPFGTFLPA